MTLYSRRLHHSPRDRHLKAGRPNPGCGLKDSNLRNATGRLALSQRELTRSKYSLRAMHTGPDSLATFQSIGLTLPLRQIYEGVQCDAPG